MEDLFDNPWSANNAPWGNIEKDKLFKGNNSAIDFLKDDKPNFSNLADAAEYLGNQTIVMESYWNFQDDKYDWFFSPNYNLKSATKKPSKFNNWNDWQKFSSKVKKTIGNLAGFNKDITNVKKNDTDLDKLRKAYKKWSANLYSIHWASNYGGAWMCNVFVGDAMFLYKRSITNAGQHYYDPDQISKGKSPLKEINAKDVKRGTIAVMLNGIHVEIITSLKTYYFSDKGFCSIGAGRGTKSETGSIKCDSGTTFAGTREIENTDNKYFKL
ncbi:hypothetical protein [Kordia sp.]|uniref:hypothetical protein n=1 Tax=Kordia sp. TaxID=1965332 RepID=UPI003D6C1EE6